MHTELNIQQTFERVFCIAQPFGIASVLTICTNHDFCKEQHLKQSDLWHYYGSMPIHDQEFWLQKMIEAGAIWIYSNSLYHAKFSAADIHSDYYFNTDIIVNNNIIKNELLNFFTSACDIRSEITIASYISRSIKAAHTFARDLSIRANCKFVYLCLDTNELHGDTSNLKKCLVVVDDIYTGNSLRRLIEALQARSAEVEDYILGIANFSGNASFCGRKIISVIEMQPSLWQSIDCPLCKRFSIPIEARKNWSILKGNSN